jgi:hypothetical protein
MTCPRCGNEWDVSKSPCTRCGLLVRLPGRLGSAARIHTPPQKEVTPSGGMPSVRQQAEGSAPLASSGMPKPRLPRESTSTSQPLSTSLPARGQSPGPPLALPTSRPVPHAPITPRPSSAPSQTEDYKNSIPGNKLQQPDPLGEATTTKTKGPNTDGLSPRSIPLRPHPSPSPPLSTDPSAANIYRSTQSLRPGRPVTDPQHRVVQHPQGPPSQPVSFTTSPARGGEQPVYIRPLMPGTLIRNGRYRLHELREHQEWSPKVYEVIWLAQDAQRQGAQVMICELIAPDSKSMMIQSMLRNATVALTSIGRNPHVPMLWDAFSDQGRNFFVFEFIEGESLLARMRRIGRALPEREIIECCLQITEVLELLTQQSPPLIHGLIRPEHIVERPGSHYVLTNFSIILAGNAVQLVAGTDRSRLSPYTAPEFTQDIIDIRSDLYALIATAYHLVAGSVPTSVNGSISHAQQFNRSVSAQFDAILAKGLHPNPSQRYQHPAELQQELLAIPSTSGSSTVRSRPLTSGEHSEQPVSLQPSPPSQSEPDIAAQLLPGMLAPAIEYMQEEEHRVLLPHSEDLPPISEGNDWQLAAFWLVGILVCLIAVVALSRGFF